MKPFFLLQFTFILISACHTRQQANTKEQTNNNNPAPRSDTTVWAGTFAQWKKGAGERFDGNYDTSKQIFKFCATQSAKKIDRSEITILNTGNCEDNIGSRFALMVIQNDSIKILEDNLVALKIDTTEGASKAVWTTAIGKTEFHIDTANSAYFIHAARTARIPTNFVRMERRQLEVVDTARKK